MFDVDWGTVSALGALTAACFGYLARQINGLEDKITSRTDGLEARLGARIDSVEARLGARIDQLTERYISHLERHPH